MLKTLSKMELLKILSTDKGVSLLDETIATIDRHIGYFMVEQKITRDQMAALLEMSPNTLRWKREGKTDWTWPEILRLSDITGKSLDELTGFKSAVPA